MELLNLKFSLSVYVYMADLPCPMNNYSCLIPFNAISFWFSQHTNTVTMEKYMNTYAYATVCLLSHSGCLCYPL